MPSISRNIIAPALKPKTDIKYSIIIPAAGMGSRMKSYGPKSLIKLNDTTTVLDNQLAQIYSNLLDVEIILVIGFEGYKIEDKIDKEKITLVYNHDFATTNVVRSIGLGLAQCHTNNIIVIYGDLVFNVHTLQVPFGGNSMVLIDTNVSMNNEEVGCIVHNHILQRMMYDLPLKWAQIVYFKDQELELLKKICSDRKYDVYFGFEIINIIINSGGLFTVCSNKKMQIIDIDSSKDIDKAKKII